MYYYLILFSALLSTACLNQNINNQQMKSVISEKYESDHFKVGVSYSDQFMLKEEAKTADKLSIRLFGPHQLKDGVIENLAVKVIIIDSEVPLSAFYDQQEGSMLGNGFFELVEKSDTTVSKIPAKHLLTTFSDKAIAEKGVKAGTMSSQFYLVNGTHLYIITGTYMEEHKEASDPILKELVGNIEIWD